MDPDRLGLRPAHEQALDAEDAPHTRADLDEFVACYRPGACQSREATWTERTPDGRWRPYSYDEIVGRDKVSLDLSWLRDASLEVPPTCPNRTC
ncbi:MAG: hypothetical protein OXH04_18120 [Acidobacteria bacterium]|nr:hypothetical protein [Acidobacteriota bacterium]